MKKFLIFVLFVGAIAGAGYYFYDPYIRPYLETEVDPLANKGSDPETSAPETSPPPTAPAAKPAPTKPASMPDPKPATDPTPDAPKPAPMTEIDRAVAKRYPMPEVPPLMEIVGNWQSVPRVAYPKQVTSTQPIAFQMKAANGQVIGETKLAPGTAVAPLVLSGDTLTIASLANAKMTAQMPVDQTDFKSQIEGRYNAFVENLTTRINTSRERAKIAMQKRPDIVAVTAEDASSDPRFAPVKASIRAGEAGDTELEEATAFQWNGTERIGGALAGSYETVTVNFQVKTIFGQFPTEYKALLQGGKVVGWVDAITDEKL